MTYTCDYCNVTLKSVGTHEKSSKHLRNVERSTEIASKEAIEVVDVAPVVEQTKVRKFKLPMHLIAQSVLPFLRIEEQIEKIHLFDMDNDEQAKEAYDRVTREYISNRVINYRGYECECKGKGVELKYYEIETELECHLPLVPHKQRVYCNINLYDLIKMNNIIIRKARKLLDDGCIVRNKRSQQGSYRYHPVIRNRVITAYSSLRALNKLMIDNDDELYKIRNLIGLRHDDTDYTLCFDDYDL